MVDMGTAMQGSLHICRCLFLDRRFELCLVENRLCSRLGRSRGYRDGVGLFDVGEYLMGKHTVDCLLELRVVDGVGSKRQRFFNRGFVFSINSFACTKTRKRA